MTNSPSAVATSRPRAARAVLGSAAVVAVFLAWASASWACGFWNSPVAAVTPDRATAASDVTITGTGWQPGTAVMLALSADGNTVMQPLGNARVATDGSFTARVPLGDTKAGVYYVSATQDATHVNAPVEVVDGIHAVASAGWSGLSGEKAPGLNDLHRAQRGGSTFPLATVVIIGTALALGGTLLGIELRRQRASR